MSRRNSTHLGITLGLLLAFGSGCSLVVGFDRTRIGDGGATDGGMVDMDGGADAGPGDGGSDAGPSCGNGAEDTGEACDDGNTTADDGCSATCTVEDGFECTGFGADTCAPICGDGMTVGDEACDDGFETACGVCNADCTAAGTTVTCGDGAICTDTEACDDSNTADDDGCSMDCGTIETGWVCAGEPSVCEETCNNGVLDMGETCDDGANVAGDGCSASCQTEMGWSCTGMPSVCVAVCGDGIVIAGEEECDDMNTAADDGCDASCDEETGWTCTGMPSSCDEDCGDGMVVGAEACDDSNTTSETACAYGTPTCTACNDTCTMVLNLMGNVCGDGVVSAGDEGCDDMNTTASDGCSATCTVGTSWACSGRPRSTCTPICGDSMVLGGEVCDDGDTVTETECDYGMATCMLCDATCATVLNLTGNVCGDGVLSSGNEMCDDGNTNSCGTCNPTCSIPPRTHVPATGRITVAATTASDPIDGQTFTLNDGAGTVRTYEIDTETPQDCTIGGTVCVGLTALALTANQVATTVAATINSASAPIGINAVVSGDRVNLTNDTLGGLGNGATGNQTITGTVTGWTITGMSGGVARNCAGGIGCTSNNDCASGNCLAAAPRTCAAP